jgi:hypothetical protein
MALLRKPLSIAIAAVSGIGLAGCFSSTTPPSLAGDSSPALSVTAVTTNTIPAGDATCPYGGVKIEIGVDRNRNGLLDAQEVQRVENVCHGGPGSPGPSGSTGVAGLNALVKTMPLAVGDSQCPAGGLALMSGLDSNRNNQLDSGEYATEYLCNTAVAGLPPLITMERIGRTESQGFDESAAEIVAFDPAAKQIYTVNAASGKVDIFNASDMTQPQLSGTLDVAAMLMNASVVNSVDAVGAANSIAVHGDLAAVAVDANPKTDNGWVLFFRPSDQQYLAAVAVGALPDMVTFTPDGTKVLAAIEGEPEDYTIDPEGRVDIITLPADLTDANGYQLTTVSFSDFNVGGSRHAELPADVRIYGKIVDSSGAFVRDSTVAEDLEPEYIAISPDSKSAYVALQENNAIAVVDIDTARVARICALGFKDHSLPGNGLDASDRDGGVNIRPWPVYGIYQPDAIATYRVNGIDYILTANEGDARADWGIKPASGPNINVEEARVKSLTLDPVAFPDWQELRKDAALGRLNVTTQLGMNSEGKMEALYAFGARSFSIWRADNCSQVFDSGSDFEAITARRYGDRFNNNHGEVDPDGRSDNKGPEPEAVVVGMVGDRYYAFIGLERMGGIMVYDVTNPSAATFVQYYNDRNLDLDPEVHQADAGDLGPEGMVFVTPANSPTGKPLLIVGNEVSGTTAIYQINLARE